MRLTRTPLALSMSMAAMLAFAGCSQDDSSAANAERTDDTPRAEQTDQGMAAANADAEKEQSMPNYVVAAYPLETCVVADSKLGSMGKPVTLVHEGREVKFCCAGCEPKFKAEPDKYLQKIDEAVIAEQAERYPVDTCVISGDNLGDEPVDFVYENRLVRLCCEMCVEAFLKSPNQHLAKLNDAAVKAQLADYPATTCPVSGADLGSMGKPIDMMVGDRLVRLCCAGCTEKTKENPAAMLAKVYGSSSESDAE